MSKRKASRSGAGLKRAAPREEVQSLRERVAALESELSSTLRQVAARNQAEVALEQSEMRIRAVLRALLDPTIIIDAYGTIQAASDSVTTVFGYEREDLVGRNISVLMPEPYHTAHDGYLDRYRRTGETSILGRTREFEVVRRDGQRIVCELSVARAEMPGGIGPLFIGAFRDVTAKRRAETALRESERRFRGLFDGAFQFIALMKPDGTVLEVNAAALAVGAFGREDVVGKPFWDAAWWTPGEMQDDVREAVQRAAQGELARLEVSRRRGRARVEVDMTIKSILDDAGAVALLIAEARDITELKSAQRSETAVLRALATVGESAAVLAHEIKNPITAVHVALRAVAAKLGADDREALEDLVARMQHLERLMRRTLSFSRSLELRRVECDARELLEGTVARLSDLIAKSAAEVTVEAPEALRFYADANCLEEVISNLITNAIEEKGQGAHVLVSASRSEKGAVSLSVEDDGPGIPAERLATIFKPFVTTKSGGTGLGLAICKKIVEAHGGTIQIEKSALGGARFLVCLPPDP